MLPNKLPPPNAVAIGATNVGVDAASSSVGDDASITPGSVVDFEFNIRTPKP
jgi:hypothetical protein